MLRSTNPKLDGRCEDRFADVTDGREHTALATHALARNFSTFPTTTIVKRISGAEVGGLGRTGSRCNMASPVARLRSYVGAPTRAVGLPSSNAHVVWSGTFASQRVNASRRKRESTCASIAQEPL
jgi:hypothetical protein